MPAGGDHPNPAVRQLQAQLVAARGQRDDRPPVRERRDERAEEEEVHGAAGPGPVPVPATPEGRPPLPLDVQQSAQEIINMLMRMIRGPQERVRTPRNSDDEAPHSSDDEDS